ncbi:hypothetical protein PYW08_006812 [Mythimna loreyi]|uniref:Uncharacterized protein n=1 Tax=Mythimna loreyi TaxID=667449 RepID=A0ACC2RAL4_9NEOP|nr:hypothetical protein PYW08_006812 [Mythimna loreyi]
MCLSILVPTLIVIRFDHWILFVTHWGLVLNTIASALACAVSLMEFHKGPNSNPKTLVKLYWASFNTAASSALFITIFRYLFVTLKLINVISYVGDVMAHVMNSVLMVCLLVSSRHPTRLLHFYFSLIFGMVYALFTIIYYLTGGLSPFNTTHIYPNLDWARPGETTIWTVFSMCSIIAFHIVVVGITLGRDALTKKCRNPTVISVPNSNISSESNPAGAKGKSLARWTVLRF